jgi:hypothetical protein
MRFGRGEDGSDTAVESLGLVLQTEIMQRAHFGEIFHDLENALRQRVILAFDHPEINPLPIIVYLFQFRHELMGALVVRQERLESLILLLENRAR